MNMLDSWGEEMFHRTTRTIQRTYKENKIKSII